MNWYKEWERTHDFKNDPNFIEKIACDEQKAFCPKRTQVKLRPVSWVRNHRYHKNLIEKFYRNFDGYYSRSLYRHYLPRQDRPTVIRRIEGDFSWGVWITPTWSAYKRSTTNRRIRHGQLLELPPKGRYLHKLYSPRRFD